MGDRRSGARSARSGIAQAAARLLVEGLADDFGSAKRKAAAQLGLRDERVLPDNRAVQAAIVEYQRLFEGDELAARIEHLRREALAAMRVLEGFEPRLVGPVLYGTPFEHSPVTLHLYTDEVEACARFLLGRRIPFRQGERALRLNQRESEVYPVFEVAMEGADFELVVMPCARLAHPPLCPLDGAPYRRMGMAELEALLAGPHAGDVLWEGAAAADPTPGA